MTVEQLQIKLDAIQTQYDELTTKRNDLNAELIRLEGEFRAVNVLKDELKENASATSKPESEAKPANSNVGTGK